jgi:deoxyribodipyrimidine photolyase-related protein
MKVAASQVGALRVVLGDQCTHGLASLAGLDPKADVVLMAEVTAEATYVRHHPKKIVLVFSAMRHFAAELEARGVRVRYVRLDDPDNSHSLRGEFLRAVSELRPARAVATEPGEFRLLQDMRGWQEAAGVETEILDDARFLCRVQDFRVWARERKSLRMEFFYRDMRRRTGLLMDGDEPAGGAWNYDAENRKRLPARVMPPDVAGFQPDGITREVMALVAGRFSDHFGDVEGFSLPVTAADAEAALDDFVANRLPSFGDWQDAMKLDAPYLFHAVISTSLNCGLLDPMLACRRAEAAYRSGAAPLNAVEGFVRQILGWREFIRGVYWLHMPEYGERNSLRAERRMPWLYWSGETKMRCMAEAIGQTKANAYAHHIQRLMVTGNFALLAGLHPDDVDEWYMVVYADAYQWVEMPNVRGMALHADDGIVGSKPYAASGAYINRMSDYCGACEYDVARSVGEGACPFNALYWDFIARHADRFAGNNRMAMPVRTMQRMDREKLAGLRARAAEFLARMDRGERV